MPGKFVVKKGSTGKFRFNLISSNGQVIATSEAYNSKASAMNGIKAVQSLVSSNAPVEDQTTKEWAAAEAAKKAAGGAKKARKTASKKSSASSSS